MMLEITNKFIHLYEDIPFVETPYEILQIFNSYKNNQIIDFKKARYLYHCNGLLATTYYFDSKKKFKIIFLTIKDLIRELDGDGFFIWLEKMCHKNNI